MGFGSLLTQTLKNQIKGFDNDFNQGFFGVDYVRDYQHASKTFVKDGFALAPTNKFLFHVFFTLNTEIPGIQRGNDTATIGVLAKTATLPSFSLEVEAMNQYNRKRYIQKKINYQPVTITLHDDGSDAVRSMWVNYYRYYYNDSSYTYDGQGVNTPGYNNRDIYDNLRSISDWGYNGQGSINDTKPAFFKDIKIYTLNKGNFKSYTMINPLITDWQHDTHDVSAGGDVMQHSMTFNYEAVKYGRGRIGNQVKGFADSSVYDTSSSPLRAGSTASTFGRGGIFDAGESIIEDLADGNILGAYRTSGTLQNTLRNVDVGQLLSSDIATEVVSQGANFLSGLGSTNSNASGFNIPSFDASEGLIPLNENFSNGLPNTNTFSTLSDSLGSLQRQYAPQRNTTSSSLTNSLVSIQNATQQGFAVLEQNAPEIQANLQNAATQFQSFAQELQPSLDNLQQTAQSTISSLRESLVFDPRLGVSGDVTSNGQQVGGQ